MSCTVISHFGSSHRDVFFQGTFILSPICSLNTYIIFKEALYVLRTHTNFPGGGSALRTDAISPEIAS